jgi:hypothetical protein
MSSRPESFAIIAIATSMRNLPTPGQRVVVRRRLFNHASRVALGDGLMIDFSVAREALPVGSPR